MWEEAYFGVLDFAKNKGRTGSKPCGREENEQVMSETMPDSGGDHVGNVAVE